MLRPVEITKIEFVCHLLEIIGVIAVLFLAFGAQLLFHELPCPLCLLQRIGFCCIAFGFLLNLRFGLHPSHYAIVILSALYTIFVALRQISLHVVPGTGSYGSAIFGLHLYTWSFIISMIIIIVTTLMFSIDRQYLHPQLNSQRLRWITHGLFAIVTLLLVMNIISVFLECGFKQCPDNPVTYIL